jgi:hypothetical protein
LHFLRQAFLDAAQLFDFAYLRILARDLPYMREQAIMAKIPSSRRADMRTRTLLLWTIMMVGCLCLAGMANAGPITTINTLVDVIPFSQSGESAQNSEPSIAVNPNNTSQLISGAFTNIFNDNPLNATTPFWISNNGGTTWADFGSLQTLDKSIAFNGSTPLAATLHGIGPFPPPTEIQTFSSTNGINFNTTLNTFNATGNGLDQPWIRTGPNNHVYVTYNNLRNAGKSASMNVSTDGGSTYVTRVLETVTPGAGQDGPSVRQAVNGNTVYAVFSRWNTLVSTTSGGDRFAGLEIVVKSTDGGVTFASAQAAASTSVFTTSDNSLNSLGQERIGSDNAIAVSRTNANRVVIAYADSPAIGTIQVHVAESTDGGATWANKLTTPAGVRSANPAITILDDGQVVLLYNSYDPQTNRLSQHLIATSDDFATSTEKILGDETNATPAAQFDPYLGDFTDLISIGDTFYGIFSASNADDGTLANFLLNGPQLYQRCTVGTPGAPGFHLCDAAFSIDPYFFSGTSLNQVVVPWPGTLAMLGGSLLGLAALRRRRK